MPKNDDAPMNELVQIEEDLLDEMRAEYRQRLARRLQEKADARGTVGPDGLELKKKTSRPGPEKLPRRR